MLKRRFSIAIIIMIILVCLSSALSVQAQNTPPIVDAGPNQSIYVSQIIGLPATAWDPDYGDVLSYLWTVESAPSGSSPIISDPTRLHPTFEADVPGDYVLSLVASDGIDWSEPDTVTIRVRELPPYPIPESPPIVDAGPDQTMYAGGLMILEGSAYDPDGDDVVAWLWTVESAPAGPPPFLSQDDVPDPLFSPEVAGEYVLSLMASDGPLWSIPDYVTIYAVEILPPVAIATANVTRGPIPLTVQFDGSQSYPRYGTELEYLWNFDDGSLSTEVSPIHIFSWPGYTYEVELTVWDSINQYARDTIEITATSPVDACDQDGNAKSTFTSGEEVYVKGSSFPSNLDVTIYVIPDGSYAEPGMAVASAVGMTDAMGVLPATSVWSPSLTVGQYDLWVDIFQDGVFDDDYEPWEDEAMGVFAFNVVPEPTPGGAIEELIADVEGMNLQQGLDNSLDAKLSAALEALEALNAGQRNDAVNKLNAFINEVEAQQGKKLTSEQADYLIAEVQAIIDGIQG